MHHFNDDSYSERLKKSLIYQNEEIKKLEMSGKKSPSLKFLLEQLKSF